MPHVLAIANQKGGVGKTTTAVNLSAVLTEQFQRKTLLIDLDPQGHASAHVGMRVDRRPPVYQVLVEDEPIVDHVRATPFGFDLLAGGSGTAIAEMHLTAQADNHQLLHALAECAGRWDCIVLDCPPSLGQLLLCALAAADGVLVPMPLQWLPVDGFAQLMERIARMQRVNPRLQLAGVFTTNTDERTTLAQLLRAEIEQKCERVFTQSVRRNTKLAEASYAGSPITRYAPASPGAEDYRALAEELVEKGVV